MQQRRVYQYRVRKKKRERALVRICLIERRDVHLDRNAIAEIVREMYKFGITTVSNWKSGLKHTTRAPKNLQVVKQFRKEGQVIWVRITLRQVRLDGQIVGLATRVINHSAYTKLRKRLQKTLGTCRFPLSLFRFPREKSYAVTRTPFTYSFTYLLICLSPSSILVVDRAPAFCG